MKPHEQGYPDVVRGRPATTETPSGTSQGFRDVAAVAVVIVAVLALFVLGVLVERDVAATDFMPDFTPQTK